MISFEVPGIPVAQGNHRMNAFGHAYDSAKGLAQWRSDVGFLGRIAWKPRPILTTPVAVSVLFKMPAPKSVARALQTPPAIKRPDLSKLVRAVEDALTDIIWKDDSQIIHIEAGKILTLREPGALIFVQHAQEPHLPITMIAGSDYCDLCGAPPALHDAPRPMGAAR